MADDDIIELGVDGTFEVPTVKPTKAAVVATLPTKQELEKMTAEKSLELRKGVDPGCYKIVSSDNKACIVFQLREGEVLQGIQVKASSTLVLSIEGSTKYEVPLDAVKINKTSGESRVWEKFVFVYFQLE